MAAEKDNVSLVYKIEHEADMSFPIEGYKGQSRYGVYRYVPLVESAGVALVAPLPSAEEKANFVIHVGTACFPMLLLTVLMVLLAGVVLWALVSVKLGLPQVDEVILERTFRKSRVKHV